MVGFFPCDSVVKNPPAMQELQMWVGSLGQEEPLEEAMATHSSILAWRIPWTEESGGLQSIGLQRVRQDWSDLERMHTEWWHCTFLCLCAKSLHPFYDSMDGSLLGSSVHGILQARILEWVAMPSVRESSQSRKGTCLCYIISCIGMWVFYSM